MADEAFVMEGLSASIAEVATFSSEGRSVKQDGAAALLRVSQALYGLVDSLLNSVVEFRDVEHGLELETAPAGDITTGCSELPQTSVSSDARPELIVVVAGALKEMVETLMSDIKANAYVQKLLPAIQKASAAKHHASFQDLMNVPGHQQTCPGNVISTPCEETLVCIPSKVSRMGKRIAGKGQVICKHVCDHHPEVVDARLWRNLPQELVEIVLAKLPLPCIFELCDEYEAWYAIKKSSNNFKEACSESHSALYGLLGWDPYLDELWTTLLDIRSKRWLYVELAGLPGSSNFNSWEPSGVDTDEVAYQNAMYACDGGLVCFVPQYHMISLPILVCNPLTSIWKTLPLTPLEDFEKREIVMVQMLTEGASKRYSVILVSREKNEQSYSTLIYTSESGVWNIMDFGLVYGASSELASGHGIPYVFDCTTKTLYDLTLCASLATIGALGYSMAKDHLFVLHKSDATGQYEHDEDTWYLVSEYVWESSISDLRQSNVSETRIRFFPDPYKVMLFASPSFVLLFQDNCGGYSHQDHHQLIGLYDRAANRWDIPPPLSDGQADIYSEELERLFMVELRWDINP